MKPTPGPQPPGNLNAISLHAEIERSLQHWAVTLAGAGDRIPHTARALCHWVSFNAYAIAGYTDADAFQDELATWCAQVEKAVGRGPTIKQVAAKPEPRHTARTILYRLHRQGHTTITTQHLSTWAARGHITMEVRGNKPCYLMTEILDWITRDKKDQQH